MNTDSDPLLRAIADEDPACPDGRMLVALGRLIRGHGTPPRPEVDVADDVLARLADNDGVENSRIDAHYDGDAGARSDADLERLGELVRGLAPRPVDLRDQVLRRIRASSRFGAITRDDDAATLDRSGRWRIWSAVVAGHFAALLAFAIFEIGIGHGGSGLPADQIAGGRNGTATSDDAAPGLRDTAPALPPHLPGKWEEARGLGTDIFLLRRFPELRQEARSRYGMEASGEPVVGGLAWLQAQQDAGSGCFGKLLGDEQRDLATQSLAILALLGEGLGDKSRTAAARRGLGWLCGRLLAGADGSGPIILSATNQVTAGLVSLALVEGGLVLGDEGLRFQAEQCLATLDRGLPMQAGVSGLGGFTLLALETAQQGGMHVPGHLLQQSRNNIGRALPAQDDDAGRLGIAAFARFILGHRDNPSTARQLEALGERLPATDAAGRVDPLGWFFATLAVREAGGKQWEQWAAALQRCLLPLLTRDADGSAHVDARKVRYGESGGEVFATSLVLLNLQAPYRYLPVAAP